MDGFVADYISAFAAETGRQPQATRQPETVTTTNPTGGTPATVDDESLIGGRDQGDSEPVYIGDALDQV
jgi:hypothetical protein